MQQNEANVLVRVSSASARRASRVRWSSTADNDDQVQSSCWAAYTRIVAVTNPHLYALLNAKLINRNLAKG
jgi:hypothetical protein